MASLCSSLHFHGLRRKLFTTTTTTTTSPSSSILSQLSRTPSRPRFFTSSILLRASAPKQAVKATRAVKPPPTSSTAKATAANAAPSRYAFIKSLATKQTPTILYESPSHFWFYFGCWSSGLSILAWTLLTGPTVIQQPEGIPKWVEYVYGAAYILLGAMGFYLISKTPNIVNTIRLLPPTTAPAASVSATSKAGAAAATSMATQQPTMEVTVKRMVPFVQPKTITTTLDKVVLKSRFSLPEEYVPQLKRLEAQRVEEEKRKQLWKFDMEHLLTMPFRRIGRAFIGFFHGVRAAWTDMGYGVIKVDGKAYKVDVTQGFAHDGFKTLERLVDIGFKN